MDDARRAVIIRLLDTRHEHLPEPIRRSEASPGFVHKTPSRVTCPDCLADDRTIRPRRPSGCETCGGRGYTDEKRERDPYATDAVAPYGLDGRRHEAARERDRQIQILGQQLRPASKIDELADANAHPYAWERARERMYREYDYEALDQAIEWLRQRFPGVRLRAGCRGNGPSGCFTLGFLDMVLPDPLRAPEAARPVVNAAARGRHADVRALSQRDEAIVRAITGGAPTAHVALSFGISISQVNKIVREEAA